MDSIISENSSHEPASSQQIGTATKETESRLAVDLRQRIQRTLEEINELAAYAQKNRQGVVGIERFRRGLEAELQFIKKNSAPSREHRLWSSNSLSFISIWAAAKCCTGLVGFTIKYHNVPGSFNIQPRKQRDLLDHKHDTLNIVAEGGLEWVKVSLKNERTIMFDMAKAGFGVDDSDSDPDEQDQLNDTIPADTLLECAKTLLRASQQERVRYKRPTIRFILPNIRNGGKSEVEKMLREIRNMGITVQTAEDIPEDIPLSADVLSRMLPDPTLKFTDTINVDVNVMISCIAEFSHAKLQPNDSFNEVLNDHINLESKSPIMSENIWPAFGGRKMVCTQVAAEKLFELVNIIGTDEEKARASLLVRNPNDKFTAEMTREERIKAFQALSIHDVPQEWNLPIEIDDMDIIAIKSKLPVIHEEVCKVMPSELHQSVFLYGWANGLTTITSNQVMAKSIERATEENRIRDEDVGPDIWMIGSCRQLLGRNLEKRTKSRRRRTRHW